jgi:hypothetical protein
MLFRQRASFDFMGVRNCSAHETEKIFQIDA